MVQVIKYGFVEIIYIFNIYYFFFASDKIFPCGLIWGLLSNYLRGGVLRHDHMLRESK